MFLHNRDASVFSVVCSANKILRHLDPVVVPLLIHKVLKLQTRMENCPMRVSMRLKMISKDIPIVMQ